MDEAVSAILPTSDRRKEVPVCAHDAHSYRDGNWAPCLPIKPGSLTIFEKVHSMHTGQHAVCAAETPRDSDEVGKFGRDVNCMVFGAFISEILKWSNC
jgi:hypothetical protein